LERFQGHFYNWYDIRLLEPLQPRYVSTVDSGNLAGHLLTMQQGQIELMDQKILPEQAFCGLQDTLQVIRDAARGSADGDQVRTGPQQVLVLIDQFWTELQSPPSNLSQAWQLLDEQAKAAARMLDGLGSDADADLVWWIRAYELQLRDHLDDLVLMAPWLMLPMWIREHPLILAQGSTEQSGRRSEPQSELLRPKLEVAGMVPITDQISSYFLDTDSQTEKNWLQLLCQDTMAAEKSSGKGIASPWLMLTMGWPLILAQGSIEQSGWRRELQAEMLRLDSIPLLQEVPEMAQKMMPIIDRISRCFTGTDSQAEREWLQDLGQRTMDAEKSAVERIASIKRLALDCSELADINYDFLFNESRGLLAIGYNVDDSRRDESCYDLLASEARLCSYVAIAQGRLRQEHWFALGRMLTSSGGELGLLSWGGTMFEYLMPLLIMPTYENTLLNQTYRSTVRRQIEYGQQRGVPWGISESGYNTIDLNQVYQYRAFGVPGLGFKRGLAKDLVIAPYASALALMVSPSEGCNNLQQMADEGYLGEYGFYEAIDYTPSRLIQDETSSTVRSFMAHHQGMSLLSMAYVLLDRPMQRRFMANPIFRAADLLLQERVPKAKPFYPHATEASSSIWRAGMLVRERSMRVFNDPGSASPDVHLLSNGSYRVMISGSGAGYSQWKDIAVTRWHGDITRDNEGQFFYIRDLDSTDVWSAGYQPVCKNAETYQAIFQGSKAEFRSRISGIDACTEVVVSPEDDVELRSISLTNRSSIRRRIELTSYAEVVLTTQAADAIHPAFSNLFVETEIVAKRSAILCTRRPRSNDEKTPWMLHLMAAEDVLDLVSFETDRSKFIGRGRTVADPVAMNGVEKLSDSEGPVLDPIVSIRCIVTIDPGETSRVNFITGMAETRARAVELIDKYHDVRIADRVHNLAWTHNQMIMQQLNITDVDINLYMRLASAIVYPCSNWRASHGVLLNNPYGQSGLWAYGISGDIPIVLLRIGDRSYIDLARQLLRAHAYWHMMGLAVDLVIWNEDRSGYQQELQNEITGLITIRTDAGTRDRSGGVFVIHADQISEDAVLPVQAAARAVFIDDRGTFEEQLERESRLSAAVPLLRPEKAVRAESYRAIESSGQDLIFFNGLGGFTADGREYIIRTSQGQNTPAPWSNVLANPYFGTVISECGSSYTWSENSQQFRLTPWYNDPVSDCSGEAVYIRDEETGSFWSPTALPARGKTPYTCRHGFGYSVFEHKEHGIKSELWVYVAVDAPVKFCRLVVRNESGTLRQLSVTGYMELVLGEMRSKTEMHVVTEIDSRAGAIISRNPYSTDFPGRIVFMDVNTEISSFTGDRTEFLGRNGSMARPAALMRERLSNRVGAAMDPCAALQVKIDLADGQESEIIFTCGTGRNVDDARSLIRRFRGSAPAKRSLEMVWSYWNRTLGVVHVETPDKALDVLTNGWLIYQTIACRMWARSGYYQSGGAYGFRDQLQDSMALICAEPGLFREHLLRCAAHQFLEGDVLHWWHQPAGRGVRTHSSDDRLWLPLAAHRYVMATGDIGVLDERTSFIQGRPLKPEEDAYYDLPTMSDESGTLHEHCVRA
ncbi:MAG TPA: glucoamylase family protein, partial [Methanotrichaceae archaeon]|nr:glucoamylase family protein [Methanotrichaceae archaeon]